jgi:hypothetical protein
MKQIAVFFITLFFIALTPARAQTTVNSEQATVPAVNSEQVAVPVPAVEPAAVENTAPVPEKAPEVKEAPQKSEPAAVEQKSAPVASDQKAPAESAKAEVPADKLPWWPTDAQPAPVRDAQKGGFWWWPTTPGTVKELWGNRGYAYVNKVIYDWHAGGGTGGSGGTGGTGKKGGADGTVRTGGAGGTGRTNGSGDTRKDVQVRINDISFPETEQKPSLLVNRTVRNQQLQFKGSDVEITPEHAAILKKAAASLKRNKDANIIISAFKDTPETGSARTQAAAKFLTDQGVAQERIYILASEKFQEAGLAPKEPPQPGTVQVLIAEVKEVMIPGPKD